VPKSGPTGGIFIALAGAEPARADRRSHHRNPVNADDTETSRNPRSGFIAYVPPGSLKKGEALVTAGSRPAAARSRPARRATGRSARAGVRFQDLRPLAELHRTQLYDMQHANRAVPGPPLVPVVATRSEIC